MLGWIVKVNEGTLKFYWQYLVLKRVVTILPRQIFEQMEHNGKRRALKRGKRERAVKGQIRPLQKRVAKKRNEKISKSCSPSTTSRQVSTYLPSDVNWRVHAAFADVTLYDGKLLTQPPTLWSFSLHGLEQDTNLTPICKYGAICCRYSKTRK